MSTGGLLNSAEGAGTTGLTSAAFGCNCVPSAAVLPRSGAELASEATLVFFAGKTSDFSAFGGAVGSVTTIFPQANISRDEIAKGMVPTLISFINPPKLKSYGSSR